MFANSCLPVKMPVRGSRTELVGWGKKRQRYANLPHLSRYRLFMALQRYDLLDFWLAGGEGAKILHEARSKLNKYRDRKRVRPASGSHSRYPRGTGVVRGSRLRAF